MNKQFILNLVRTNKADKTNLAKFAEAKARIQEAEAIGIKFIGFTEDEKMEINTWIRLAKAS